MRFDTIYAIRLPRRLRPEGVVPALDCHPCFEPYTFRQDDKNIFIARIRPGLLVTILIPLPESSIQLMLGLDSCPGGALDAANDTEHTKNINRSSDMMSSLFTAISEGFANDVGCPRAGHR